MSDSKRQAIVAEAAWDLSETAKERLSTLAESVEFESEDHYRQKLNVLKESFLTESQQYAGESEYLEESTEPLQPTVYEGMTKVLWQLMPAALSRTVKQ